MRIGIDLGGKKIEAALIDAEGRLLRTLRAPVPHGDYDGAVRGLRQLVEALAADGDSGLTVGVGIPGSLDPKTSLVKNAPAGWLNGRALQTDLTLAMGRPVRVANAANCFALAEALDGAGSGEPVVFGVLVGAGCAGGIVAHGHVLIGPNAIAGEWGHHPLPWPDMLEAAAAPRCYCGGIGCIETWISGPALEADYHRAAGAPLGAGEIAARARDGDPLADAALTRYETRMARALAQIINVLDPDVIVLGGAMSTVTRLYENVPPLSRQFILSKDPVTRLVPNRHGDASRVRGAAWLWPEPPTEPDGLA
ncbi:MAG: ROK family protein [Alphaproteobacteria bacterium]